MKKRILLISILFPLLSIAQNIQIGVGSSISSLEWYYRYSWGELEHFYQAPLVGATVDFGIEYLEREHYSFTSNFGYFQSGGQIADDEVHENWIITETKNKGNNVSIGTNLNIIPIDKKFQLMLSFGPRLDYLIPSPNSSMAQREETRKIHFGLTSGLGFFYNFDKLKIGFRSNYLHRFTDIIDVEGNNTDNWWETQTLGVRAKDKLIVTSQFVIGFKL